MKRLIIAIDGPSGAGKGTVSRALAQTLGYRHIDTGAMYRAVGWKAHHDGIPLEDEAAVAGLARSANLIVEGGVVNIDGHDVTTAIRTPEVDKLASTVARLPQVREVLLPRESFDALRRGAADAERDGDLAPPPVDLTLQRVDLFGLRPRHEPMSDRELADAGIERTHQRERLAEIGARDDPAFDEKLAE